MLAERWANSAHTSRSRWLIDAGMEVGGTRPARAAQPTCAKISGTAVKISTRRDISCRMVACRPFGVARIGSWSLQRPTAKEVLPKDHSGQARACIDAPVVTASEDPWHPSS